MAFYLILDRAQIHKKFRWFNPADVHFYSFANDGSLSLPGLNDLLHATDLNHQRELVQAVAKDVLNQWESVEVRHVDGGHIFKFGDTGRILYKSSAIPDTLDWIMLVIDSHEDVAKSWRANWSDSSGIPNWTQ
jgi:hypothetical protein